MTELEKPKEPAMPSKPSVAAAFERGQWWDFRMYFIIKEFVT